MQIEDSVSICAKMYSFKNRLDILEVMLKRRDPQSHDRIVYEHCRQLFKKASEIRNKYMHATFSKGQTIMIAPFHNDFKGSENFTPMEPQATLDRQKMSAIYGELFQIIASSNLPAEIYDQLAPEDR